MVLSTCTVLPQQAVPGLLTDEYLFLLKRSVQNITNGKAFSIHEYTEQGTNGDFLLVSKLRLKTTPMFALEKQMRLERKQTRFILTLPVAGAVWYITIYTMEFYICGGQQKTARHSSVQQQNVSYIR